MGLLYDFKILLYPKINENISILVQKTSTYIPQISIDIFILLSQVTNKQNRELYMSLLFIIDKNVKSLISINKKIDKHFMCNIYYAMEYSPSSTVKKVEYGHML